MARKTNQPEKQVNISIILKNTAYLPENGLYQLVQKALAKWSLAQIQALELIIASKPQG
jgi:hypothetical protein